jgi:tRNA(Ile)-lysidine synthase
MAASRKPPSAEVLASAKELLSRAPGLRGKRLAAGLSGGIDSIVLLHVLRSLAPQFGYRLSAVHVHHGLSPSADDWLRFCSAFCRDPGIPFKAIKVKVAKKRQGLEAAAREARRAALSRLHVDAIALGHQLDDQAETVLLNLLRGAGTQGASGMAAIGSLGGKILLRPLLDVPRTALAAYARENGLNWIEDESNENVSLTRNFLRHRVGPLLAQKFPRWQSALARAARHFADRELDAQKLLRAYLKEEGLRAPSEAKLLDMIRQLGSGRGSVEHEGKLVRAYRGKAFVTERPAATKFRPMKWSGESRLAIPALGGELRFRKVRGKGIDGQLVEKGGFEIRLRSGGERLKPDANRPRRTLKNLFQEAGVPPWERERLPLLYRRDILVWVPGIGVDAEFQSTGDSPGIAAEWKPRD